MPPPADPHSDAAYARSLENFRSFVNRGLLVRDGTASLYVYRLVMGGRAQTGVACCCAVADYMEGVILRHEKTRVDKEEDRLKLTLALSANTGPVFLAYRPDGRIDGLVRTICRSGPDSDFTAPDGVRHTLWRVPACGGLVEAFGRVPRAYIADGHHRAAAACRLAAERGGGKGKDAGDSRNWFMGVLFPADQLRIMPYNRCVRDLNGLGEKEFMQAVGRTFETSSCDDGVPGAPGEARMYLAGRWIRLTWGRPAAGASPVSALDVSVLQDRLLGPVLGISDPRTDRRIDFIGGIRGVAELERRVGSGEAAVAFSMYPVGVDEVMRVSDAGLMMPPKSTWFEPKLRSGLFVYTF
jgi:uncharacterized protein (DUF1015 family)